MSKASVVERWKSQVRKLKVETYTLYLAYKDPRVPWHAKVFAACVVGYAFSPIDLIPDFIPVLGYLDDLVLIPLGIALALKMIPKPVLEECRAKAQKSFSLDKPINWVAGGLIIAIWVLLAALIIVFVIRAIKR
ncbi:MAG: YkvA family protein [Candidatus Hodarchaeota archaeon]